ncbi:MAG: hypothetical protein R2751_00710 [Bacteroidales bacterium]
MSCCSTEPTLFNLPRAHPGIFLAMCVCSHLCVFTRTGGHLPDLPVPPLFPPVSGHLASRAGLGDQLSFLHVVYYHPMSMVLTLIGGIYFARVYQQTGSVLFSALLHGLMGILVFGIGLGKLFWLDMPL